MLIKILALSILLLSTSILFSMEKPLHPQVEQPKAPSQYRCLTPHETLELPLCKLNVSKELLQGIVFARLAAKQNEDMPTKIRASLLLGDVYSKVAACPYKQFVSAAKHLRFAINQNILPHLQQSAEKMLHELNAKYKDLIETPKKPEFSKIDTSPFTILSPNHMLALGVFHQILAQDLQTAEKYYKEVIASNEAEYSIRATFNIGMIRVMEERFHDARIIFEQVAEQDIFIAQKKPAAENLQMVLALIEQTKE